MGESVGGVAGLVDNGSIWDTYNNAAVKGTDGKDKKIGGLVGTLKNSSTLTDVRNFGAISGTEDVGGIAGYVENGTILGTGSAIYNYANTYNTGKVTGTTDTGGIVGHAKGIYMYGVFNTNEDAPLSKTSQLIIGDDNKVIQRGDGTTSEAGTSITAGSLQSGFGKVKGGTNTGGLVGYLEDAPTFSKTVTNINVNSTTKTETDGTTTKEADKDAPITNNVIDTSYNAGNITGTGDNTGGLVGQMTGGTLSNVYNADNNTVLREQGTIPDAVKNAEIKDTSDNSKTYKYSVATVSDCNNQDLTQYYSFFTVDDSGSRTYYYFIPVSITSGTTQKGAGGIYVDKNGSPVASLPSTKERYYFNRTFNKDANVTGTGKNTGGLVGSMTTTAGTTAKKYIAGSVIDSAYNAGTITGNSTDTTTTGALVGSKDAASLINDSFYVIGQDVTNGKVYSNVNQAVGTSVTDTSGITDTGSLGAIESKKKYYVSDDSKRTNFPGVQQKTLTEKGETDSKTTTYYEYTSGTNGSFYTDGTGSMDSISHIYPITTTGTKDSTGKTTYTSSRSKTAAYTRQDDGTFQDAGGNTYTAAYDTATRQIVLMPVSGSSSTAATVVLNAVLAARTANETWTIYEDQTRPLLTAFLNKASLSRTFSYDGTTHNLKTDDVANLYGRADFDGDAGKDVQLSNYQLSSNGVSSEYTYDNTSIWSPQHGYYMDPESTLVINPVNMSANLYGTRVYGDIFNTRGYYVCVPYTENGTKKYSFYKPVEESGKEGYTLLKDTDSDKALTDFFGDYEQTEDGLLKLAEEKGFYVLELNGFINGEGVDNLGKLITGLVSTLSNSSSTTTTSGSNLQHLFSSVTADTYLDAGIYNVTNAQITGLTATNQNYTINYGGTLTVKQAELYYTYDGKREYGAQNKDGEHTYTLVGVDSGKDKTTDKYTSTHGFLKYWDLNDKTITIKNDDGTETTITNPYTDFFKKNGDTYEINQDNIGVTGYTAEKTTTTTDVTTGKSTTVKSKDDTKSASLDDIYTNMTGTINKDSINLPSTDTEKVIGSYGDGAVNDGMYTHVLVDKDGKPIGYKVTSFASSNKDADGTIQLYFKASSDTTNTADKNMQAAVDKFNKNYKLVWKEGGTYDKVYTIGDPEKPTPSGDAGIKTETDGLKVNDSTFTILPKTATVTITGNRQYGDTMSTQYTTDGTAKAGHYNIAAEGLASGDSLSDILNTAHVENMLSSIENQTTEGKDAPTHKNSNGADGKISKYTDVKRNAKDKSTIDSYSLNVGSTDTSSTITLASKVKTDAEGKVTSIEHADKNVLNDNNYDYIINDGTHTLTINPVDLTVDVKGESTYGKTDTKYTVTDVIGAKNNERPTVGDATKSNIEDTSAAGSYTVTWMDKNGTDVSSPADDVMGEYLTTAERRSDNASSITGKKTADGIRTVKLVAGKNDDNSGLSTFNSNNYNITYHTTQVINPEKLIITIDGTKVYGSQPTGLTTGNMNITSGELATDDSLAGLTIANNMGQLTDVGTYYHTWSMYAGGNVPAEKYTYKDVDGQTHAGDSTANSWITGVTADNKTFDFNNYDVDFQSTYTVTKRPLQLDVTSTSVYGDTGYTYKAAALDPTGNKEEGLVGNQKFNTTDIEVSDDITAASDAGTYTHTAAGTSYTDASNNPQDSTYNGITAVAADSLKDAGNTGFKSSNYAISLNKGKHTVGKRTVRAKVSGSQVYGESASTSGEAYAIDFEKAGGTGAAASEGLANGQTIDNGQVTVQNSVGVTNDVGTYTTSQSDVGKEIAYGKDNPERVDDKNQGIYGIVVSDGKGVNAFNNNNYNIVLKQGSYTVTKRPVTFLTTGSRTYGEENSTVKDYTIQQLNTAAKKGLTGRNAGTVTADKATVLNATEALTDAGSYGTESKSAQVLNIDPAVQTILGDDYKNYDITYKDEFTINPRTVRVTIDGESTYGDAARAAGTDYKTIAFERAGADGVKAQEGLVGGQTIDKSQVTIQTNGIGEKTDAGTYYLSQGAGTPGISGIKVTDGNGFQNKNYKIEIQGGTYTVNKHPLTLTIKGEKTYGDPTSFRGRDYTVSASGLRNNETIDFNDATVLHSAETGVRFSNAGEYHSSDGKGILGFEDSTLHGDGFKLGNYELTYDTVFTIDKRPVDVYMESRRMSGSPSSARMDEPMTMRNVPEAHQGRFLADMQIIDTAPQVIAARDYPGFDGSGYLDLRFAGDIYRNYIIHRHTIYHILPDRMMKPGIYYAVQPERRPILDVMYFKVNGSEGINRWAGTEKPPYDGEIILNKDVTNSIPAAPDIMKKPGLPARLGQEFLKEEVTQAVPVVYTDGRKQDVRGRYHLAYENNHVVIYPASDDVSVPRLKERPVSSEIRRVMRVPYQGGEGEYHVAYADGIVQVYPQNETAYRLVQAKGKDEQLLLQSSLTSAVQELGASLEDINAVYVYTK